MAPSALGVRRAADGVRLTVSRSRGLSRRHRDPTAVENKLGEEPRGSELPLALSGLGIRQTLASVRPWHPSDLGIRQTWASLRPGHPSDLGIPQTCTSLRPENPSDLKSHKLRQPRAIGCSRSDAEAASAKKRDGFSRLLASFRVLASLADFVFSSFLRASVPPCLRASVRNPEPNRRLHHCSPTRFPEAPKKRTPPGSTWRGS